MILNNGVLLRHATLTPPLLLALTLTLTLTLALTLPLTRAPTLSLTPRARP